MFIAHHSEKFLIVEVHSNQDRSLFQGNCLCTRIDGMTLGGGAASEIANMSHVAGGASGNNARLRPLGFGEAAFATRRLA
jgi:hypothetical protein